MALRANKYLTLWYSGMASVVRVIHVLGVGSTAFVVLHICLGLSDIFERVRIPMYFVWISKPYVNRVRGGCDVFV